MCSISEQIYTINFILSNQIKVILVVSNQHSNGKKFETLITGFQTVAFVCRFPKHLLCISNLWFVACSTELLTASYC